MSNQVHALIKALAADPATDLVTAAASPAKFDKTKKLATMESLQAALGNFTGYGTISTNTALTLADAGKYYGLTAGGWTITLPDPTNAPPGIAYTFGANSAFTLAPSAGKQIAGPAGNAATARMAGMCSVVWRGDIWQVVVGGDGASLVDSGWQKLPSGLILQWGRVNAVTAGSSAAVTFPIPFPTALLCPMATIMNTGGQSAAMAAGVSSGNANGMTVFHNGNTTPTAISWLAIGW